MKEALETNPVNVHEWHGMNNVLCISLFMARVCNMASVGVCAQRIRHFCLCPKAFIYRALWAFTPPLSFCEEAAWSCQGVCADKKPGVENDTLRVTDEKESNSPWNQLYGTDTDPRHPIQLSPHKQTSSLTYSNERSSFHWTPYFPTEQNRKSKLTDKMRWREEYSVIY